MSDLNGEDAADINPYRGGTIPPVAMPVWPGRRFVDLIAESLREVAKREGDVMFHMIAHAVVQHLAGSLHDDPSGRTVEQALDGVLSLISRELQHQVACLKGSTPPAA